MDYREEYYRHLPKKYEDFSKIDHTYLLTLLRESMRRNDIEMSTEIVNGTMTPYYLPNDPTEYRMKVGGLICYPPAADELKDRVILEVVSAYDQKRIRFYEINHWMQRGLFKSLPKYLKGSPRNALIRNTFKAFTKEDPNFRKVKIRTESETSSIKSVEIEVLADVSIPVPYETLDGLVRFAIALNRSRYSQHPILINEKWCCIVGTYINHIRYIERSIRGIRGFELTPSLLYLTSMEDTINYQAVSIPSDRLVEQLYFDKPFSHPLAPKRRMLKEST